MSRNIQTIDPKSRNYPNPYVSFDSHLETEIRPNSPKSVCIDCHSTGPALNHGWVGKCECGTFMQLRGAWVSYWKGSERDQRLFKEIRRCDSLYSRFMTSDGMMALTNLLIFVAVAISTIVAIHYT